MLERLFDVVVLEHVVAGLIVAALRHRRQQTEKNLRVELARLKPDARERRARPFGLQQPFDAFVVFGIRIVNPVRRHLAPVLGLSRFTERIDQLPGALAERREDKQPHHVLFGQARCDALENRFALVVIDKGTQRAADEILV